MSKITKATFKSFLKKNKGNLYIKETSRFDGMVDCVMQTGDGSYSPMVARENSHENECGYAGVWLVGGGRDYFEAVSEGPYSGIRVFNCCGSFTVAKK